MATPPTLISNAGPAFNTTTTPKTQSVTVQTGDIIVVTCGNGGDAETFGTPTGGSLTYTAAGAAGTGTDLNSRASQWTAVATSNATFSVSVTSAGSAYEWLLYVHVWRGSDGVGANASILGNTSASLTITTGSDNSAIVVGSFDYTAKDGTTRTMRTPSGSTAGVESVYGRDGSYACYMSRHLDAGAAGAKVVGWSAPTAQQATMVAVEIKGAAGAAGKQPVVMRNPARGLIMR